MKKNTTKLVLSLLSVPMAFTLFSSVNSSNVAHAASAKIIEKKDGFTIRHTDDVGSPEDFKRDTGVSFEDNKKDTELNNAQVDGYSNNNKKVNHKSKSLKQHYYRSYDLKNIKGKKKQIIIRKNILSHKHFSFAKKGNTQRVYKGQKFNVKKVVKYGKTTRLLLTNNNYVTGNTRFVKLIK